MKKIFLAFIGLSISVMAISQSAVVLNSLERLPNSNALVKYNNEFGRFENKEIDDSFPYVVIRMELQGDVQEAKTRISLDLGSMYKVEASDKNRDNMILFLIPKGARSIYLLCGDGCEKQQLYYGTLLANKIYTCKVDYKAKNKPDTDVKSDAVLAQLAAMQKQMDEMKKQNEQMQQLLHAENNSNTEVSQQGVTHAENNTFIEEELKKEDEDKIFYVVEELPEFPGGMAALKKYFRKNVRYPVMAQEMGIQGKVYVKFTVWKDGSIRDPQVIRSVDKSLDAEAIRLIRNMPNWKPGRQRGKTVNCTYTVPVTFKLSSTDSE